MHIPTVLTLFLSALPALSSPLKKRVSRTTAPAGCLTIGASNASHSTLSSALNALGASGGAACIFMHAGTYTEQVTLNYSGGLTIYGETTDSSTYAQNTVTITHTISSPDAGGLDKSSTVNIVADGVALYNINISNGYGKGAQAVALTANADRLGFYACAFSGYQDTLYAKHGTQYYSNSHIVGAKDYVFGAAAAWFGECVLESIGQGTITASSREADSPENTWYVFDHSTVTGASDLDGKVYLGRPWRVLARVAFQNSKLGAVVNKAGWKPMAEGATPAFYEFNNEGAGADTGEREYLSELAAAVDRETVLGSDALSWIDTSY
ncbi:carbohydrate esterase family 8 protein [Aplosporella prunicola CBS 121167]|uniref:pectinesterase n=1 Tax=Aplosporella prunicola CBS 121167 TaxID=1176127 RepID=A0A6A6B0S8_9PEZI|nr:carbohydrate esterase family 8 protein [Aplosporella prunicola CBS 121167]KAF2136824.1 carbohydrate esterase family 8 protein [Aplosporella prunicola CBS 121167]